MTAYSIGASKGGGYARYLESKTVEPERGDYYLTPTGEPTQAPGRWLADQDTLALLGIKNDREVVGGDFIALMDGRHPVTGQWLRPEGAGGGGRRDRRDVQRAEVGVGGVGARGPVAAREDRGRARERGRAGDVLYARRGAARPSPPGGRGRA